MFSQAICELRLALPEYALRAFAVIVGFCGLTTPPAAFLSPRSSHVIEFAAQRRAQKPWRAWPLLM